MQRLCLELHVLSIFEMTGNERETFRFSFTMKFPFISMLTFYIVHVVCQGTGKICSLYINRIFSIYVKITEEHSGIQRNNSRIKLDITIEVEIRNTLLLIPSNQRN